MTDYQIIQGDCVDVLAGMPERSVHCCVTSPPYWGLRDYGTAKWEGGDVECDHKQKTQHQKQGATSQRHGRANVEAQRNDNFRTICGKCGAHRIDNQLGLEKTPDEYLAKMVEVFRAVRRVMRDDATLWCNMGDRYNGVGGPGKQDGGPIGPTAAEAIKGTQGTHVSGLKPKDLCGMPWRLALALQADGWYLRSDIIWHKPNPMPDSATDRPGKSYEHVFLLTKKPRYFYDAEAVRKRDKGTDHPRNILDEPEPSGGLMPPHSGIRTVEGRNGAGCNLRDVWKISTEGFKAAHFAVFPRKLVEPCIKAGTSDKGCCPECGAPWVRIVVKPKPPTGAFTGTSKPDDGRVNTTLLPGGARVGSGQKLQNWLNANPPRTVGWKPGCVCQAGDPVPCLVADIFAGSGTTGVVATQLGRRFIGIELNPTYAEMARRRIENPEPEPVIPDVEGQATMEFAGAAE